jgi:opacity protein-like surface antigen
MAAWKALPIAASLALAVAGAARANELPPAPALPAAEPAVETFAGFYLRGDAGVGVNAAPALEETGSPFDARTFANTTLSPSALVDLGVGYQFNIWFRVDGALEYRGGARLRSNASLADPASPSLRTAAVDRGDIAAIVGLVNAYVNGPTMMSVTPFVGAGVGFADNRASNFNESSVAFNASGAPEASSGGFSSRSKTSFAWALMAGLDFALTPNLRLEIGYRYLDLGAFATRGANCAVGGLGGSFGVGNCVGGVGQPVASRRTLASNDIRIGLIWTLGEQASPSPAIAARY